MAVKLKRLNQQVMVITGVSSGIGLVTARAAAERGTRLVLASRSQCELQQLKEEITANGGQAIAVGADVGQEEDVRRIAQAAQEQFGGFDTWVNNAGVSIYGKLLEISIEDMRRLFETNFWGVVYGSLEAARNLKQQGGAIINIGSLIGPGDPNAGDLQRIEACGKRFYRCIAHGARRGRRADLGNPNQAGSHRHALFRPCKKLYAR
jgi:short-subunit dehydrogenase